MKRCPKCRQETVFDTGEPYPWKSGTWDPPLEDADEYTLYRCNFIGVDLKGGGDKLCGYMSARKPDGSASKDPRLAETPDPKKMRYAS